MKAVEVLATGPLTLIQDRGRPGLAAMGVGAAGAADRAALARANRLVGNPPAAAGLEILLGGLVILARSPVVVAVTGAPVVVAVTGAPVGERSPHGHTDTPVGLAAGHTLAVGEPAVGVRTYLAIRGGVAVAPVLGSRSRDTLAGLGPGPLAPGDVLPVGAAPKRPIDVTTARTPSPTPWADDPCELRVVPGPREDWLATPAAVMRATWRVSSRSDRVGIRLEGPPLLRAEGYRDRELPSEGTVRGAIQVPPDGTPVIFGPDHPLTGGYPVTAVIVDADLDATAQLRPGQSVRFRPGG